MAEPQTEAEKTIAAIGPIWEADPAVYSWEVQGPNGPVTATFQWHKEGGVFTLPSGDMPIKDARSGF